MEEKELKGTVTVYDIGSGHDGVANPNPFVRPAIVHWRFCRKCRPELWHGNVFKEECHD